MIIRTKGTLLRDQAPPAGEPGDRLLIASDPSDSVEEYEPDGDEWTNVDGIGFTSAHLTRSFSHYPEATWLIIREGDPEDDALLAAAREQDTHVAMGLPGGQGTLWSQSDGIETQIGDFAFRVSGHSMRHELVRVTMSHPDKRAVTMDIPFDALAEFVVGELQKSRAQRGNG